MVRTLGCFSSGRGYLGSPTLCRGDLMIVPARTPRSPQQGGHKVVLRRKQGAQ
jgi:hypothetical protein